MIETLYSIENAKKLLGVSRSTILRWESQGKIKCVRTYGGHRRIPESEIKRILSFYESPHPKYKAELQISSIFKNE